MTHSIRAVLFDLDGTLADTAPDLGHALNEQRRRHGLPPLPQELIRPHASHGARGLLAIGFNLAPTDADFTRMREEYLQLYADNLCLHTRLFPGMAETLETLETRHIPWGVVTNKPERFTHPLMERLGLRHRAACTISGDTCSKPKPHPEPILCACRDLELPPADCIYVGDAERDVEAAVAAGMEALVAAYGYLGEQDQPGKWGAKGIIAKPEELLGYLR